MKQALVWSKEQCPYCVNAKQLLSSHGYTIEERIIGTEWSREQLLESVPTARTVPQIFLNGEYVGGYDDLKKVLV